MLRAPAVTRALLARSSRLRLRLALALALALGAGCGPAAPAPPGVPLAETAHPPLAPLRVGTSGDYAPFSTWKDDHTEGFAGALLGAFAADERLRLSWTRFHWPDLPSDLRAGRFDVAADGITVRPERSVAGRFTVPVARGGAVLLLRRPAWALAHDGGHAPEPADRAAALAALHALDRPELRGAVNRGGPRERVARSLLHLATIRAIAENSAVPGALAQGEADAVLTTTFEAPRWAAVLGTVEALGPLTEDTVALYVRADRPDLEARLDAWLLAQEQSGALAALRARHLGPGAGGPTALALDALLAATAERLALMPLVAAAKQRASMAVEDSSQEARVIEAGRAAVRRAAAGHGVAPLPDERTDAFFRAQIEAAKAVQQRVRPDAGAPALSLEDDLRPAIARITARMAFLLVRLPRGATLASVQAKARDQLAGSGLEPGEIDRLAAPLAALGD